MTWIKPSFLWLMERSNWGRKSGQERILAVRITRAAWEKALSLAVLTTFEPRSTASPEEWQAELGRSPVHVQWDPERSLRGARLAAPEHPGRPQPARHRASTPCSGSWASRTTPRGPARSATSSTAGQADQAERQLPPERVYPVSPALGRRLLMTG